MDRRNPHNSYRYKPMDQAAPIYVPPSHTTQRSLPVPQKEGQTDYHYGAPGQATPIYVPPSKHAGEKAMMNLRNPNQPMPQTAGGMGPYGYSAMPQRPAPMVQNQPMRGIQQPPPQAPPKKDGGGGMGGMMGGMMAGLSDERSKKEIQRLESANAALSKALSGHVEYPQANAQSPGLQALGQQENLGPMQARFADAPSSPVANKVAAQNVGLQSTGGMPQGEQRPPQQANFTRSQNPAFNVQGGPPDLSALDEAYKRQGMGG